MSAIINALSKALAADPGDWESRHALIEAHLENGDGDSAVELLNELSELPDDERSLILAGKSYALVGGVEDGLGIIQAVIDANPGNADAHFAMASIAHESGDAQTAAQSFAAGFQIDSDNAPAELSALYQDSVPAVAAIADDDGSEDEPAVAVAVVEEDDDEAEPKIQTAQTSVADPNPVEPSVVEAPRPLTPPDGAAKTVALRDIPSEKGAAKSLDELTKEKGKDIPKPSVDETPEGVKPATAAAVAEAADAPLLEVVPEEEAEYDPELEEEARMIAEAKANSKSKLKTAMMRDKMVSLSIAIAILIGLMAAATFVVIAIPRDVPPSLTAAVAPNPEDTQIDQTTLEKTQVKQTQATSTMPDVVSVVGTSNIAMPTMAVQGDISAPAQDIGFAPSMTFGAAMSSPTSMMMFGQQIEGETLGVILDVSGSMGEYLPAVISEVDRNFKNAPIVFVNNALMMSAGKNHSIYPIVAEEVMPHWPKEWEKGNSPYWFLWHDLPRKTPQRTVDRLIKTFKERPNMFIARGNGRNRIEAAANFLAEQDCDSLYIFSDFEDFVDEEVAANLGQVLGRRKMRTYVQPAAMETEHLDVVHNKVARRTLGKRLPPLADLLRPQAEEKPIAVEVDKPTPVPDGVVHATRRAERVIDNNYYYWNRDYFKDELKVFEYERFDIVLHGPEARAYIYLKTKDGFIQRPVAFGYHSAKYHKGTDDRWHWRRRKFLRHIEEPKLDGNEFTWNMMLEDELEFKVVFWFKEDTATGTYVAERPDPETNERGDDAHIYFIIPPLAREKKDMYYGPDYPEGGLTLDDTRIAVTDNRAIFHLPGAAADRYEKGWENLGFKRGHNVTPYNVIYRTLPNGIREVTVQGPSFADLALHARTTSNKLLLSARGFRNDTELWEGFVCRLVRSSENREKFTKTEAIEFSVDLRDD